MQEKECRDRPGGEIETCPSPFFHDAPEMRKAAVKEIVRIRGIRKERVFLSQIFDGLDPLIDPGTPITKTRIDDAARKFGITTQEAISFYKSIATVFHLKFE